MILAECLPQPNILQPSNMMEKTVIIDELAQSTTASSDPVLVDDKSDSISTIKIPLVSFQPILATSPNFILVNEYTKRRNQFVLYDEQLQTFTTRSFIRQPILDGLWYENEQQFLLLTATEIFALDPNTMDIQLIQNLIPDENKNFKCFAFLNQSTLLTAYNEWGTEYIDKWEQDSNDRSWKSIGKLRLDLNDNEFIGNILTTVESDVSYLAITIHNILTEQWRLEIRNIDTSVCLKKILLPGSNVAHDYGMVSIRNTTADLKFLIFSPTNTHIIALDSKWTKVQLNYKNPVQRMALFKENHLIVRTTERVDIHLFL